MNVGERHKLLTVERKITESGCRQKTGAVALLYDLYRRYGFSRFRNEGSAVLVDCGTARPHQIVGPVANCPWEIGWAKLASLGAWRYRSAHYLLAECQKLHTSGQLSNIGPEPDLPRSTVQKQ